MASFCPETCSLHFNTGGIDGEYAAEQLSGIPSTGAPVAGAFVHEYVHYIQLLSSVHFNRTLVNMADLLMGRALHAAGMYSASDVASGAISIAALVTSPGFDPVLTDAGNLSKWDENEAEVDFVNHPQVVNLAVEGDRWDVVQQTIGGPDGSAQYYGLVSPNDDWVNSFRLLNVGLVADNMARVLQRRFLRAHFGVDRSFGNSPHEQGQYWSVYYALLRRFPELEAHAETRAIVERIAGIVCQLAILTPDVGFAIRECIGRLEAIGPLTLTAPELARSLLDYMGHYEIRMERQEQDRMLLDLALNRRELSSLRTGPLRVAGFVEEAYLHAHVRRARRLQRWLARTPHGLSADVLTWDVVRSWMQTVGVPRVVGIGGIEVEHIDGIPCTGYISRIVLPLRSALGLLPPHAAYTPPW